MVEFFLSHNIGYFENEILPEDFIKNIYPYFYKNLIHYIKSFNTKMEFLKASDLMLSPPDTSLDEDSILPVDLEFADDLNTNGMYWPVFCYQNSFKNKIVLEGKNRVRALQHINSDRKFLTITINREDYEEYYSKKKLVYPVELFFLYPSHSIKEFLISPREFIDIKKIDKDFYKIITNRYYDVYVYTCILGCYLGRQIQYYRDSILPDPITNDETIFNQWKLDNNL